MAHILLIGIYAYVVLKDDIRQTEEQLAISLKAIVKRRVSSFAQPDVIVVRGTAFKICFTVEVQNNFRHPKLCVNSVIILKELIMLFYYRVVHPNNTERMANSGDQDQTAPEWQTV